MSTKITADNGVELEVCHLGIDATNPNPTEPSSIWARLTPEQRAKLAAALSPPRTTGQWTREDLPSPADVCWERTAETWKWRPSPTTDHVLDAVVAHLNAHHPKSGMEARLDAEAAGAEMTAAYAARDAAKRRCDELRSLIVGQSVNVDVYREKVREAERQRDDAHTAYEKAARERDEAVARSEHAEQLIPAYAMLDIWVALGRDSIHFDDWYDEHGYAEAWAELTAAVREARTAPAVTRDDIDRALINVTSNAMNYPTPSQMLGKDSGPLRKKCVDAVCDLLGIEAEQVVDPVEEKAEELMRVLAPETEDRTWGILTEPAREDFRRLARHVLGQEADQ